jgi:predicted HAD superfamily hydrolase
MGESFREFIVRHSAQIRAERFTKNFKKYQSKRILLYGIGNSTKELLENKIPFCITGLLDKDESNVGSMLYGLPVVSISEASQKGDMIIINTAEKYQEIIYERIKNVKLPIYFKTGIPASSPRENTLKKLPEWEKGEQFLRSKCEEAEVIIFDFFDVLFMRRVIHPNTIYELMERKIGWQGEKGEFAKERERAGLLAGVHSTLEEVYKILQESLHLRMEEAIQMAAIEFEIECEAIIPRQKIAALVTKLQKEGKELYLFCNCPFTLSQVIHLCQINGIGFPVDRIWVLSEKVMTEKSEDLWDRIKQENIRERKFLYVMNHQMREEQLFLKIPQLYLSQTVPVMSGWEMAQYSAFAPLVLSAQSLEDKCILGLLVAKVWNDPFALHFHKGIWSFEQADVLGYCMFGTMLLAFFIWILNKARELSIRELYFFARDGYFLLKDYDFFLQLRHIMHKTENMPKGFYLLISKRAIAKIAIKVEADLGDLMSLRKEQECKDFAREYFHLEIPKDDRNTGKCNREVAGGEEWFTLMRSYADNIWNTIHECRNQYLWYLNQFPWSSPYAIVDLWSYTGMTQYLLGKIKGTVVDGFYFLEMIPDMIKAKMGSSIYSCYCDEQGDPNHLCIRKNWKVVESFLTSPEGMFLEIDRRGNPVYAPKRNNQRYFAYKEQMNKGVQSFMQDYDSLFGDTILQSQISIKFADEIFRVSLEGLKASDKLKKSFFYDEEYHDEVDTSIFDNL